MATADNVIISVQNLCKYFKKDAIRALDMGITNKAFDSYEQGLIRDVIAARIPAKLDAGKLFA